MTNSQIFQSSVVSAPSTPKRLLELDALRGITVLLVVIFHLTMNDGQIRHWTKFGVTGVDLFFVISGFVILLTLERINHWQDFVISRFSRLYPTYWFCVTFTTVLVILKHIVLKEPLGGLPTQYLANMTMFQSYFRMANIDGPYWTMTIEMLFYLFMFAIFLLKKLDKIEFIGSITLIPVIAYHLLLNTKYQPLHQTIGNLIPLINHFPLFLSGIIFYRIVSRKATFIRYLIIVFCFNLQYVLFFDGGSSNLFISHTDYGFMLAFYLTIFILYANDNLNFIVNDFTLFFGKISYGLYLIHQFLGVEVIIPVFTKYFHANFLVSAILIAFPSVVVIAFLINKYIEKPAMVRIRGVYKKYQLTR